MKRNLWHPLEGYSEVYVGQYIVPNFASNSVAIRCASREWVVVSPGEPLLRDWRRICPDDPTQISLVLPNSYHFLGVGAWREAFPHARLYASAKASQRLRKKGLLGIRCLEEEGPDLPEHYKVLTPPGHRGGDVWLSKKVGEAGALWVTCDSFQNYERLSNQPIARLLQKLLGTAPGLKMSQLVKWLLLDHRRDFKHWVLAQLEEDEPVVLVPSHGEVEFDSNLADRLRSLVRQRL